MDNYGYASFWKRFFAFFVDTVIILYPLNLFTHLIFGLGGSQDTVLLNIPLVIVWSLYRIILPVTKLQGTIGKALFGMKIIDQEGNKLSLARSAGRYLSELVSLVFFIGYIMAAFTKKNRSLHDKLAKTYVVYKDKTGPGWWDS